MNLYQTLGDLTCVKFLGNGCIDKNDIYILEIKFYLKIKLF